MGNWKPVYITLTNWKNWEGSIRLKMYTYQIYKWECSGIRAVTTWDWNVRIDKDTYYYM